MSVYTSASTTVISNAVVCRHCGLIHVNGGQCPRVRAIEYYPNGTIKRVEYHDLYHFAAPIWGEPALKPPYIVECKT